MTSFFLHPRPLKALLLILFLITTNIFYAQECDNVTNGGVVAGDESGCNAPIYDPSPIVSLAPASGGTGAIEYIWMKTTGDPNSPFSTWQIIPGATGETYDPLPISQSTYYGRCSRRAGCTEYLGETKYVLKAVSCCDFEASLSPLNPAICTGESITFSLTTTGDSLTYLWEASGGSFDDATIANPTYTMMMIGTYSIKVTISKNGCEKVISTTVSVENQLPISISASISYIEINEILQLTSTSSSENLTYLWTASGGAFNNNTIPNPTYSATTPGDFQIYLTVTDQNGCSGVDTLDIGVGDCILAIFGFGQDATCTGLDDGSIDLTIFDATGTVTFTWDNGIGNIEDPSNLAPGTYNVTATDAEGCFDIGSFDIGFIVSITLSPNIKRPTCSGDADGQILIVPSGGSMPYSYFWSNGLPDTSFINNLSAGTYSLTVTDGVGCVVEESFVVDNPNTINLTIIPTHPDCGLDNGSAALTVGGGTPAYSYAWNDPNNQTTATAINLAGGTYEVVVTDANGCTNSESIIINSGGQSDVTLSTIITDANCNTNDGAIDLTINGGIAPYTITWDRGIGNTEDPTNLSSGTYNVTVTDSRGCGATAIAVVGEIGTINISINSQNISCNGGNDGTISATPVGGVAPYTFLWANGLGSNSMLSNLSEGTYSLTVTDSAGCTGVASVTLIAPTPLVLTVTATNADCNNATGSALAEVSGGTAGYTFQWNDAANQPTQSAINLDLGIYSVVVTDANGCTATDSITILTNQDVNFNITPNRLIVCGGIPIQFTGSLNDPNYTYSWIATGGNFNDSTLSNPVYTMMMRGVYTIIATINNGNNCVKSDTAIITILDPVTLSATSTQTSCDGQGTGSIDLTITTDDSNPLINWDNGIGHVEDPSGVTPGTYSVTVTNSGSCSATLSETISADSGLMVVITPTAPLCNGENTGTITTTVLNGTPAYTYRWNNFSENRPNFTGLAQGTYTVTVTDANGCTGTASAKVHGLDSLKVNPVVENADCDQNDGRARLDVMGGTPAYFYAWGTPINQTTAAVNGLTPGSYAYTVTDANGCSFSDIITVLRAPDCDTCMVIGGTISTRDTTTICAGDGIPDLIKVSITGNSGPNSSWIITDETQTILKLPTSDTFSFDGAGFGTCLIWNVSYQGVIGGLVVGQNLANLTGCKDLSNSILVTRIDCGDTCMVFPITIINSSNETAICRGTPVNLSVTPNNVNYTYQWTASGGSFDDSTSATPIYTMMMPGTYEIIVVVSEGSCSSTDTTTVTISEALRLAIVATDVTCAGESTGAINTTVSGGTPPYTYSWNNGIGNVEDPTDLPSGDYNLTVTDSIGCSITTLITIGEISNLSLSLTPINPICDDSNEGSITSNTTGGIAPISYNWSNGAPDTNIINNLAAGTYSVTATDAMGCSKVATADIIAPNPINVTIINSANGDTICPKIGVNLSASPIDANLTYSWTASGGSFDDASSPTPVYTMMMAGTHQIYLTVSNGTCTASDTTTVTIFEGINYSISSTDVGCNGDSTGTLTVTVNSGLAPFTYSWNHGIGNISNPTGLGAGIYNVTITDAKNCQVITSDTISEAADLTVNLSSENISCNGFNNGAIIATINGGTSAYTLTWSTGETNVDTIENLAPGTYILTVVDANGCTKIDSTTITENPLLETSIGSINVGCNEIGYTFAIATGGTPPYNYLWNDAANQTTDTAFNLVAGTYFVTVSDANGCSSVKSTTIVETEEIICSIKVLEDIKTFNGMEGRLEITATGGSGNYSYFWNNGGMDSVINDLSINTYIAVVQDDSGCECADTFRLENPAKIGDFVFEDVDSNGIQAPGEIGIGGVALQLSGTNYYGAAVVRDTLSDANGMYMFIVPPGTYKITVVDALGLSLTMPNQGGDDDLDSDINIATNMSQMVTIAGGDTISNLDIGLLFSDICNNVLSGGRIQGHENVCGPNADPAPITNLFFPSGGSGVLEYIWLMSHKPTYFPGDPDWVEIPSANGPDYDPGIITDTTYYIRCARRKGCDNFPGETNIIQKNVLSCLVNPNVENLRVNPENGNIALTWEGKIPATKGNFIIERSDDGINFLVVNTMESKLSTEMEEYHYMDESPRFGENYYRIQTFLPNTDKNYSNIAMAMIKENKYQKVKIYPNPVQNEVTIHFVEDIKETAVLQVISGFGQILKVIEIEMPVKKYQLNLSNLPSGMYYLKFNNKQLKRFGQKIYKLEE